MQGTPNHHKLVLVKTLHTVVWVFFVTTILCILYAGAFDKVTGLVWFCIGLVIFEGIILLINKWKCPLTLVAGKYIRNPSTGFDIYLPKWLAKHNKTIFSALFGIGLILVLWRVMS